MTADIMTSGNLQLAIQARSFNNYFYLDAANNVHPARFIGNKVAGILFENKVDCTSTSSSCRTSTHTVSSCLLPSSAFQTFTDFIAI
jgi:endoglucanase Acf2